MHLARPVLTFLASAAILFAALFFLGSQGALPRLPLTFGSSNRTSADEMSGSQNGGYRSVAYFVNWAIYGRKHRPQDLPVENLTHVLYAFANVRQDTGEVHLTDTWADTDIHWEGDSWNDSGTNLYGCLKQLNLLKRRNRNLKVLLSVGGWTYSSNFKAPASTPQGRETFARSCVELVKNLGFDGIDIDWEYPQSDAEAADLVSLLRAVREALDAYAANLPEESRGHRFELTVASPAGPQNYNKMRLAEMGSLLDFFNVMTYDFAGSWDATAGHQANMRPCAGNAPSTPFSAVRAVDDYLAVGVPPSKIVMGMPLYGRAFEATDGPGRPFQGVGQGTWEQGVYDYKALPHAGAQEMYDQEAGASWSYDPSQRRMVSYDTVEMARRKAEYVAEKGLGGAMWWESSADKTGEDSLIGNVVGVLNGAGGLRRDENCLRYPETKYDNLRSGFQG